MKSKTQVHHVNGDANSDSGSGRSPSPPKLPPRRSTCRRRLRSKAQLQSSLQESFAASILVRRNLRYLFVLALLYVAGLVMCEGPFSKLMGQPAPLSSVYRSQEVFLSLWQDMKSDNSSSIELSSLWKYKRKLKEQKACVNFTSLRYLDVDGGMMPKPSNYLIVEAGGGLNQQRSVICNAVAVAGILNAILVIPHFKFHKIWRDSSKFGDIYDEDHFIATLKYHVKVVKELPEALMEKYNYDITNVTHVHVEAWAPVSSYIREVYPVLQRQRVIRLSPFANRLAMNVPPNIQFLRCLTNFEALRFSHQISTLAQKLVNRMTEKSSLTNGKYVSVHLRFKEDMAAFSCCAYDREEVGKFEMDSVREKGWKGKLKQKARIIEPSLNRVDGKCPLTPVEVGWVLRGMGFRNKTPIYLASGKIYREERYLSPLLKMFPNLHTKDSLATADELAPFKGYSSRLAALDYMLCLFSEAFVATQGGNFPHFLMGHRRFLYGGHAKTIMPDKQKLVVMLQDVSISWKAFKDQMELMLQENDWKGIMVPRVRKINRKTSIYKYPLPECRCLQQSHTSETDENVGIPNWYLMTRI